MKKIIKEYLGMETNDVIKRLPSYIRGSVLQTIASHSKPRKYPRNPDNPNLMFVPGLFCSPSVFNSIGERIEDQVNVYLPKPFPYWFSMLCNTGSVQQSSVELCKELKHLANEGVEKISLVGHSLGGIIILESYDDEAFSIVDKVILMSTPLNGSPITKLLGFIPACKDLQPGSNILRNLDYGKISSVMVSELDSIVPYNCQIPFSSEDQFFDGKVHQCSGFQHMDFFVGSKHQIDEVANYILHELKE
jgi:hypothetical protein